MILCLGSGGNFRNDLSETTACHALQRFHSCQIHPTVSHDILSLTGLPIFVGHRNLKWLYTNFLSSTTYWHTCATKWPKAVHLYEKHCTNDNVLNSARLSCHYEWLVLIYLFTVCIFVYLRMPLPIVLPCMSIINGINFLNFFHLRFWYPMTKWRNMECT
jgi:hypothetical protein